MFRSTENKKPTSPEAPGPETNDDSHEIEEIILPDVRRSVDKYYNSGKLPAKKLPFAPPPDVVNAYGRSESAAVWWSYTSEMTRASEVDLFSESEVVQYDVKRYRMEKDGVWSFKGSTAIQLTTEVLRKQTIISGLKNGYLYRFTVTASDAKGTGSESAASNVVLVEPALPHGWTKQFDEKKQRFFYLNVKTRQSTWNRPEDDLYFLKESVRVFYTASEIANLREIFEYEISNFEKISMTRLVKIVEQLGDHLSLETLERLASEFLPEKDRKNLDNYQAFMVLMQAVKLKLTRSVLSGVTRTFLWLQRISTRGYLQLVRGGRRYHNKRRLGNWKEGFSDLLGRWVQCTILPLETDYHHSENVLSRRVRKFYKNTLDHETRWDIPEEVCFYLPVRVDLELAKYLSESGREDLKALFRSLDVENVGCISEGDLHFLLQSFQRGSTNQSEELEYERVCDYNATKLKRRQSGDQSKYESSDQEPLVEFDACCVALIRKLRQQKNGLNSGSEPKTERGFRSRSDSYRDSIMEEGPTEARSESRGGGRGQTRRRRRPNFASRLLYYIFGYSPRYHNRISISDESGNKKRAVRIVDVRSPDRDYSIHRQYHPPHCFCGCRLPYVKS